MYAVYMHKFPNNKVYIGITSRRPEARWGKCGEGYKYQKLMWRAIQKYRWENIEHIVITDDLTKEDACSLEINLIRGYSSTDIRYGYNISSGGECGGSGVTWSNEKREYFSKLFKGRKLSDETKNKIRQTLGEKTKGHNSPRCVFDVDEGVLMYNDLCDGMTRNEVAVKYGVSMSVVDRMCRRTHWTVREFPERFNRKLPKFYYFQYGLDGNLIHRWSKLKDASEQLGINGGSISDCCRGKLTRAGRYRWKQIMILDNGEEVNIDYERRPSF